MHPDTADGQTDRETDKELDTDVQTDGWRDEDRFNKKKKKWTDL